MTRHSLRALLARAARLLEDEAAAGREACENLDKKLWTCRDCRQPCKARRIHDRQIATARELRDAAAKGIKVS